MVLFNNLDLNTSKIKGPKQPHLKVFPGLFTEIEDKTLIKSGTISTQQRNTKLTKVTRSTCLGVFIYKMILNREFKGNQECENKSRNSWHGGTPGMRESPNTAERPALKGSGSTPSHDLDSRLKHINGGQRTRATKGKHKQGELHHPEVEEDVTDAYCLFNEKESKGDAIYSRRLEVNH